ncbi:hypothetical protein, partial [Nocardia altamirensis]|uniref:hypothetical protein n=1 Tax=Nocardia altamirensis TaxID=472158 RepID=UPI001C3FAF06
PTRHETTRLIPHTGIAGTLETGERDQPRINPEICTPAVNPHPFWTPQNQCGRQGRRQGGRQAG